MGGNVLFTDRAHRLCCQMHFGKVQHLSTHVLLLRLATVSCAQLARCYPKTGPRVAVGGDAMVVTAVRFDMWPAAAGGCPPPAAMYHL
jgi:hypothetical protein